MMLLSFLYGYLSSSRRKHQNPSIQDPYLNVRWCLTRPLNRSELLEVSYWAGEGKYIPDILRRLGVLKGA